MDLSLQEYRRIALMSLWTGMIATVGFVFALIPNIEFVLLSAFLGGIALGARSGFLVALLGEAIFSALNPIGSGLGFPILYAFQLFAVGVAGWTGGLLRYRLSRMENSYFLTASLGVLGFSLTLLFDTLTAMSFPLSAGLTEGTLLATFSTGLVFFMTHLISNTILFGLFGPTLIRLVNRQLLMHGMVHA